MNKTVKNSLLVVAIVIIIFAIIWLTYDLFKKEPVNANVEDTNLADENTGLDNIINELFDNVIVNEMTGNTIEDNKNEVDENKNGQNTNQSSSTESVTSKEEKAIELVKKQWGDTSGVYFSNMSIDNQGRYIVSVNDKGSTKTLAFFVVDVEKELVTKQ